jgi:Holliday junction resolvasome RuvABC endonuclease subunit
MLIVIAFDPGSGASSPTGVAVFNAETKEIILVKNITASHKRFERRIKKIVDQIRPIVEAIESLKEPYLFFFETFIIRGRAADILYKLTGGLLTLPSDLAIVEPVPNTTVKMIVGGHGHSEKIQVGYGVLEWFRDNEESHKIVKECFRNNEWDKIDALAIGIAGLDLWQSPREKKVKKKKARRIT